MDFPDVSSNFYCISTGFYPAGRSRVVSLVLPPVVEPTRAARTLQTTRSWNILDSDTHLVSPANAFWLSKSLGSHALNIRQVYKESVHADVRILLEPAINSPPPYRPPFFRDNVLMDYTLTPADIEEFRAIWREDRGEELPLAQAEVIAPRFLSIIHQIITLSDRAEAKRRALDDPATEMT
jgi:hypothetical protein